MIIIVYANIHQRHLTRINSLDDEGQLDIFDAKFVWN